LWLEGCSTPVWASSVMSPRWYRVCRRLRRHAYLPLLVGGGAFLLYVGAWNLHAHRPSPAGPFSAASSNSPTRTRIVFRRFNFPIHSYPAQRMPMPGSAWGRGHPISLPYAGRVITVTNLWKAFGPQDLFTGADLRVGARERVALVGPNGSGKTTLFEMLAGTESPDRGEIAVLKQADIGYLRQEADVMEG